MLEPREADILLLFLVLVVLPLVAYFFLGKWSEVSTKREKISLLAHFAAEEALRAETMAAASVIPVVLLPKKGLHMCARCFVPATTRCSRCKAVRYCSGRCQIIHWRQVHKEECLQLESDSSSSFPGVASFEESGILSDNMNSQFIEYFNKQAAKEKTLSDNINHCPITTGLYANGDCSTTDTSQVCAPERSAEKRGSRKSNGEMLRREDVAIFDSCVETSRTRATSSTLNNISSKEAFRRHKKLLAPEINGAAGIGVMEMMGLRKSSKLARQDFPAPHGDRHKKIKMLFPYEEFVNFFQCEVFDLSPRGLRNCGNSCYANAVLQCLTCTKPLSIYLLHGSHSRACYGKDLCLMCELEQHVMLLREPGGPLSPIRILSHIRSINCQMGDGSQEDAHEFLRLFVASMQSICLEILGGEQKVDPRLQEATFIQQTFGGRLTSKVKCLRCSHESERYENIMDLTLEIYGWVETLEDALTQFTTPEDLDGENTYRCGSVLVMLRLGSSCAYMRLQTS